MYNKNLYFHFIGIGGVGMSGIAEVLLAHGFRVSGTDMRPNEMTRRLEGLGASIFIGHKAEHLPKEASLVVYSSAVNATNPEIREAKKRALPIVRRADVLAELMRLKFGIGIAGSHGKTTTTSMTAAVLETGGLDPTVIIGGQVTNKNTGARVGKGEFLVAESDESDRSFLLLKPTIAVVTNIDNEHMSAYSSRADLEKSFKKYLESVPFYGLAVLGIDDPTVRSFAKTLKRRKVTYGFTEDADLVAKDVRGSPEGMQYSVYRKGEKLGDFSIRIFGGHIVQNSLASIAIGLELGLTPAVIAEGLKTLSGVKRRLEIVGTERGVTVMNDYGHHPTEIKATLRAVKECLAANGQRVIAAFQPHRYTRTQQCWDEFLSAFSDADRLIGTDIYSAGEASIDGVSGERLLDQIHHSQKTFVSDVSKIPELLATECKEGDVVVLLGAGSIGYIPDKVTDALRGEVSVVSAEAH